MSSKDQNTLNENEQLPEVEEQTEQEQGTTEPDPRDARIAELEAQLAAVQQQQKDAVLRARAEAENIRRRAELDVEKAHKFALEKFAGALLPVIDSLERALELADKTDPKAQAMTEGIELTLKALLDTVRKFGVEIVDETAVPFNPDVHQAMSMVESAEMEPNHVLMVMQKGYTLNGRLLRPAMVSVSRPAATPEA